MRSKMKSIAMSTLVSLGLLGGYANADYITDAKARVDAANWKNMVTTSVVLKEYSYLPSSLNFKVGVPYKLQIQNQGAHKHYFTSTGFFKAIATRKVQSNSDGEIKAPYFLALEIFPSRSLDLYFVPVKKGTYKLHCTVEGHEDKGMHGIIVIE